MAERLFYEEEPAILTALLDITDIKNAEKMKDEFISTLSHELRTPLTSIIGSLGITTGMFADSLSPEVSEMLDVSRRNADHLVRLINDLLDLQKVEMGNLTLDKEIIRLADLITYGVALNKGYADKAGVSLKVDDEMPHLEVLGDWDRLIQVLSNLISNAVKFSPKGETVEVMLHELSDQRARISVCDKGPGIPAEFKTRIFQRFAQADSSDARSVGGTGLGLSISKSLVEAHDGTIGFVTDPDVGTNFFFRLPLAPEDT